ncbi:hypothetical protein B0I35DRAFT_440137 [Stachybotrys elegans]|uniref:Uncharacterized protein n=1 Tax=Stachybotrys elegans TaxID=80388 RepID=A0A8K0SE01_9HYPO|nr:hypothetical protein B0I35DRAFT_440137 [Stachybotrys elegans]
MCTYPPSARVERREAEPKHGSSLPPIRQSYIVSRNLHSAIGYPYVALLTATAAFGKLPWDF